MRRFETFVVRSSIQFSRVATADTNLDKAIDPYKKVLRELTTLGPVIMLQNRIVVPKNLRKSVLKHLHAAHGGTKAMIARAVKDVYWPNYILDIEETRNTCASCNVHAPSNPPAFSNPVPDLPSFPFQVVCSDFFSWKGKSYLIFVDKYSNWLSVLKLPKDDTKHVILALRQYFTVFGVAEELCTDGASVYTSQEMQQFCKQWGVRQRISSAYNASSNKRAEIGVKSAKRLIRENTANNGSLETDKFARALLSHRNTPDPESQVSPAQIFYGRAIRDHIPKMSYLPHAHWQELAAKREDCFLRRHYMKSEKLDAPAKALKELHEGDKVYIQDQSGSTLKRWNKSGTIIQSLPFDSFLIKVDGSNAITKRNRKFLRQFVPYNPGSIDTDCTSSDHTRRESCQDPPQSPTTSPRKSPAGLSAMIPTLDNPMSLLAFIYFTASQDQQYAYSSVPYSEGASTTQ